MAAQASTTELQYPVQDNRHLSLSDDVWMPVFLLLHSPADISRLGSTCRQLHRLILTRRRLWMRFQKIDINIISDIQWVLTGNSDVVPLVDIRTSAKHEPVLRLPVRGDRCNARERLKFASVFTWLFGVCRPSRLFINVDKQAAEYLPCVTAAIPQRQPAASLERVSISMREITPGHVDAFHQLLLKLPTENTTHVGLHLVLCAPTLGRIVSDWLRNCCPNLTVLICRSLNQNEWIPSLGRVLASLPNLRELRLFPPVTVNVMNENRLATITQICCDGVMGQFHEFHRLNDRARKNVVGICCVFPYSIGSDVFDVAVLPAMFPNCRRIEFISSIRVSTVVLDRLCDAYRQLHMDGGDEGEVLRVTIHVPDTPEVVVKRVDLVEITTRPPYWCSSVGADNCCAVRRQFS